MIKCDICNKEFVKRISMTNHRRWHDLPEYKEYQEKFRKMRSKLTKELYKDKTNHPNWNNIKKKVVTIGVYHRFIEKRKIKPKQCEICKEVKELELSFNHSLGNYTRNIEDYKWICRKCHVNDDGRNKK